MSRNWRSRPTDLAPVARGSDALKHARRCDDAVDARHRDEEGATGFGARLNARAPKYAQTLNCVVALQSSDIGECGDRKGHGGGSGEDRHNGGESVHGVSSRPCQARLPTVLLLMFLIYMIGATK